MLKEPVYCFVDSDGDVLGFKIDRTEMVVGKAEPTEGILPFFARDMRFFDIWRNEATLYAKRTGKAVYLRRLGEVETMETFEP